MERRKEPNIIRRWWKWASPIPELTTIGSALVAFYVCCGFIRATQDANAAVPVMQRQIIDLQSQVNEKYNELNYKLDITMNWLGVPAKASTSRQ